MAKTTTAAFHPCNAARQPLFVVAEGVPVGDALERAYCLLDVAEELAAHLSDPGDQDREQIGHACHFLLQMAKATVEACSSGLAEEVRHG